MESVFSHACIALLLEGEVGVIRFVRSEVPYASPQDMIAIHAQAGRVLDRLGRGRHLLLVDMRRAQMNNDPEFEKAAERARAILVRGFSRVAVLVETAVGALQVKRHVREDGRDIGVFSVEAQALEFLGGKVDPDTAPPSGVGVVRDGPFGHLARLSGRR